MADLGIAVILAADATPAGFAHEDAPGGKGNANNLLLVKVEGRRTLRYFTGAGWTRSGQFAGPRRAGKPTCGKSRRACSNPLPITVSAKP